jgi:hypothetical protein
MLTVSQLEFLLQPQDSEVVFEAEFHTSIAGS